MKLPKSFRIEKDLEDKTNQLMDHAKDKSKDYNATTDAPDDYDAATAKPGDFDEKTDRAQDYDEDYVEGIVYEPGGRKAYHQRRR